MIKSIPSILFDCAVEEDTTLVTFAIAPSFLYGLTGNTNIPFTIHFVCMNVNGIITIFNYN